MKTLTLERSSGEVVTGPDPSWRGLYRAGGISAVLFVVLAGVVPIVLGSITPLPPTSSGEFASLAGGVATLQYITSNRSVFILNQVLFFGPAVLVIVAFLALYMALKHLNKSYAAIGAVVAITSQVLYLGTFSIVFGLVYLSDLYMAATTAAQRAAFATTAEGLIAQYNTVSAAGILMNIGILILSLVMIKGVFQKGVAYLGIITGALGIMSEALRPILGYGYAVYGILSLIWLIAVGWKLYRLG
jgi:hypothetical protein